MFRLEKRVLNGIIYILVQFVGQDLFGRDG